MVFLIIGLSLPTHMGLHHHGDQPQVAGYTLKELFHLARAVIPSQRTIALQTLTAVVSMLWKRAYGPSLDCKCKLMQFGLALLVRKCDV